MERNRRERTSPATNNRMFHPASATSFPYEPAALPLAGKIRFARYRSVGLATAQTDCPDRHFSLSATFLLWGFEIVTARKARGQSQLSVESLGWNRMYRSLARLRTRICARTNGFLLAIRVRINFFENARFPLVKRLFSETVK